MNLSELTTTELISLSYQISFELIKRIWWVILLILIIGVVIKYLQLIKGDFTLSNKCSKCGEYHTEKAKFEFIASLKFDLWLYKHYKKEHNENILIELIKGR